MSAVNEGIPLSGSNSLPITIDSTASPGTLVHVADTNDHYINTWVNNTSASPVLITVVKGLGSNYVIDSVTKVPPQSIKIPLEPGILLTNLQEYRIYSSVANVIKISGFVLKRSGE
jgi:hypothetical protein